MDGNLVAIGVNALVVAFGYGVLTQKVRNIEKILNNGFTCKQHAGMEKEIGRLQGAQDSLDKSTQRVQRQADHTSDKVEHLEDTEKK